MRLANAFSGRSQNEVEGVDRQEEDEDEEDALDDEVTAFTLRWFTVRSSKYTSGCSADVFE